MNAGDWSRAILWQKLRGAEVRSARRYRGPRPASSRRRRAARFAPAPRHGPRQCSGRLRAGGGAGARLSGAGPAGDLVGPLAVLDGVSRHLDPRAGDASGPHSGGRSTGPLTRRPREREAGSVRERTPSGQRRMVDMSDGGRTRREFLRDGGLVALGAAALSAGPRWAGGPRLVRAAGPVKGGVLKVAQIGDPPTLDCMATTADVTATDTQSMLESLFALDAKGVPQPMLATAEQWSNGNLTLTMPLRQGVTFHDGSPMTAADVVASLKRGSSWPPSARRPRPRSRTSRPRTTARS